MMRSHLSDSLRLYIPLHMCNCIHSLCQHKWHHSYTDLGNSRWCLKHTKSKTRQNGWYLVLHTEYEIPFVHKSTCFYSSKHIWWCMNDSQRAGWIQMICAFTTRMNTWSARTTRLSRFCWHCEWSALRCKKRDHHNHVHKVVNSWSISKIISLLNWQWNSWADYKQWPTTPYACCYTTFLKLDVWINLRFILK